MVSIYQESDETCQNVRSASMLPEDELICSSPESVSSTSLADYWADRGNSSTAHVLEKCGASAYFAY